MNVLDIFSGIGGFSLGLERAGMRTVAFVEIDPYCRAVLRKHWPDVPIYEDIKELTWLTESGNRAQQTMPISEKQRKPAPDEESFCDASTAQLNLLYPQVLQGEALNIADGNAEPPQCEGKMGQMPAAVNGCEGLETPTGKMALDTSAIRDTEAQKFANGGGGSSTATGIGVSTVGSSPKPRASSTPITSSHGPNIQNIDSTSKTESLFASPVTKQFMPEIDVLTAGFPCQPASHAGQRRGTEDDRWLWPEIVRVVRDAHPTWIILENVYGLLTLQGGVVFEQCMADLEALGYEIQPFDIPACAVDAPHRRSRLWICARLVAHSNGEGCGERLQQDIEPQQPEQQTSRRNDIGGCGEDVAHADDARSGTRKPGIDGNGSQENQGERDKSQLGPGRSGEDVAHARLRGSEGQGRGKRGGQERAGGVAKSQFCRMDDELPPKLDGDRVDGTPSEDGPSEALQDVRQKNAEEAVRESVGKHEHISPPPLLRSEVHGGGIHQRKPVEVGLPLAGKQVPRDILQALSDYRESLCTSHQRRLDKQRPLEFDDAVQFLSYILASQTGRHSDEEREVALQGLRQAVLQIHGTSVLHSQNEIAQIWQSLADEEANWCIVAACLGPCWSEWPGVPRVATGIPNRVDRLRALGNAVVPAVVEQIGRAIMRAEKAGYAA